jgi:HAD superfamily hydrolase (TIGR01509 family)
MAVASGGTRENVLLTLEAIGVLEHFAVILTADDAVNPKPDPAIFLEAARRMGVTPERCQVFEDGDPGLQAARSAGMTALDVRDFLPVDAPAHLR